MRKQYSYEYDMNVQLDIITGLCSFWMLTFNQVFLEKDPNKTSVDV